MSVAELMKPVEILLVEDNPEVQEVAGMLLEQLGYRVYHAESATVALTSLQFMRDDRDAAVSAIERVFGRKPVAADPGRLMGYGSFMRWPDLKAAMRKALP